MLREMSDGRQLVKSQRSAEARNIRRIEKRVRIHMYARLVKINDAWTAAALHRQVTDK